MFQEDATVKRYASGLAATTAKTRLPVLKSFLEFVGLEPTEAVEFQRKNPMSYRFVDLAYDWLKGRNLQISSMQTKMGTLRGFFLANRAPLPKDRHRFHSEKAPVVAELTVEEFRKIVVSCNLTYRAAYMVQFQSGSGVGELLYINTELADHIWDEIKKGKQIIRLNLPGRKSNRNVRPYYSFIGSDAVDTLKQLFYSRGWKRDSVLFRSEYGEPLSKDSLQTYFRNRAFKLGLIKRHTFPCLDCGGETVRRQRKVDGVSGVYYLCTVCHVEKPSSEFKVSHRVRGGIRYRMRTHELRDLFRTEWHRAQTYFGVDPDAGEFFMGHMVDPLKYDKIMRDKSYGLEQFRKAVSMLNVLSEDPRKVDRSDVQNQLEASEAKVDVLSKEVAVLRREVELGREAKELLTDPEVLAYLKRVKKRLK